MKRTQNIRIIAVCLVFIMSAASLFAEYGDNPELPKHFTSLDEVVEFDYPLWWAVSPMDEDEDVAVVALSNSPSFLNEDYAEPGIVTIRVIYGRISAMSAQLGMQWPGAYDIHSLMLDDLGYFENDQYVPLNTESLYIDNKPAFMTILSDYDSDFVVVTLVSSRNFCVFAASVYPGELEKYGPLVMRIAKTMTLK